MTPLEGLLITILVIVSMIVIALIINYQQTIKELEAKLVASQYEVEHATALEKDLIETIRKCQKTLKDNYTYIAHTKDQYEESERRFSRVVNENLIMRNYLRDHMGIDNIVDDYAEILSLAKPKKVIPSEEGHHEEAN